MISIDDHDEEKEEDDHGELRALIGGKDHQSGSKTNKLLVSGKLPMASHSHGP